MAEHAQDAVWVCDLEPGEGERDAAGVAEGVLVAGALREGVGEREREQLALKVRVCAGVGVREGLVLALEDGDGVWEREMEGVRDVGLGVSEREWVGVRLGVASAV